MNYTCSRTLADKYGYDALKIGLVLLSYGMGKYQCLSLIFIRVDVGYIGSMFGSVLGGRWSDYVFRRSKARNGGVSYAEVCLSHLPLVLILNHIMIYVLFRCV